MQKGRFEVVPLVVFERDGRLYCALDAMYNALHSASRIRPLGPQVMAQDSWRKIVISFDPRGTAEG